MIENDIQCPPLDSAKSHIRYRHMQTYTHAHMHRATLKSNTLKPEIVKFSREALCVYVCVMCTYSCMCICKCAGVEARGQHGTPLFLVHHLVFF